MNENYWVEERLKGIIYLLNHELQEVDVYRDILMDKGKRKLAHEIIKDLVEKLEIIGIKYSEKDHLSTPTTKEAE
jgi:hypothetical protein